MMTLLSIIILVAHASQAYASPSQFEDQSLMSFIKRDESDNELGANRCTLDRECDRGRLCSSAGWCHFPKDIKERKKCNNDVDCNSGQLCPASGYCQFPISIPDDEVDELKNDLGPGKCQFDRECSKSRVCGPKGECMAKEAAPKEIRCTTWANCTVAGKVCSPSGWCLNGNDVVLKNEKKCKIHNNCDSGMFCSPSGWCKLPRDIPRLENRCNNDIDCPGDGRCTSAGQCSSRYLERNNKLGAYRCQFDRECTGDRVCSIHGWCIYQKDLPKSDVRCYSNNDCSNNKICSLSGWCF